MNLNAGSAQKLVIRQKNEATQTMSMSLLRRIKRGGAHKVLNKNINPPVRPLFWKAVDSAKEAKQDGIPKPKENPSVKLITSCIIIESPVHSKGKNETNVPNSIHAKIKWNLLILSDSIVPINIDVITPK